MARSYTIFLDQDQAPDRGALQAAVKALGFRLSVDESYAPLESAGYLPFYPCLYQRPPEQVMP